MMFLLTQNGRTLVTLDHAETVYADHYANHVKAKFNGGNACTLGKYDTFEDAKAAFDKIVEAIEAGKEFVAL